MAATSVSLSTSWSSSLALIGPAPDGYFAIESASASFAFIDLRSVSDPTTTVGTASIGARSGRATGWNASGDTYYAYKNSSPNSYTIVNVAQSGGALSIGTIATGIGTVAFDGVMVAPDNTQVLPYSGLSDWVTAVDVATGTRQWTVNLGALGHLGGMLSQPAVDQFIWKCNTHNDLELWNGAGTALLDSMSYAITGASLGSAVGVVPAEHQTFVSLDISANSDPKDIYIGSISSSGSALAWDWGPTTVTTNWTNGTASAKFTPIPAAWAGTNVAVVTPFDTVTTPSSSVSMVVVDLATQQTFSATADTLTSEAVGFFSSGAYFFAFCGPGSIVKVPRTSSGNSTGIWSVLYTVGRALLRQRQSPKRTPSRVRGPDLRQRQTPFIT